MGKILVLIIIAAIVLAWFRARLRNEERGEGEGGASGAAPARPRQLAPERMVSCAQCGLNLPASEAVFDQAGTPFCGAPHLEAHRARAGR